MFDLDEGFHALQNLDLEGRKALVLAGKLWEEIYRDEHQHVPAPLTDRYLTELSGRAEEVRDLKRRLDDVLDSREKAEIRAEKAESLLAKTRAWVTSWGLSTELDLEMRHWRPHCRRAPSSPQQERPDQHDAEGLLRRQLNAAREAEHRAFRIAEHERDRAVAAEQKIDELRDEVGRLRGFLDF